MCGRSRDSVKALHLAYSKSKLRQRNNSSEFYFKGGSMIILYYPSTVT